MLGSASHMTHVQSVGGCADARLRGSVHACSCISMARLGTLSKHVSVIAHFKIILVLCELETKPSRTNIVERPWDG